MKRVLLLVFILLFINPAQGAFSPVSLNILPPVQFPPSDFNITGIRISALYGRQRSVYGVDLGVIGNVTELNFGGVAVSGIFNWSKGQTTVLGAQIAGGMNLNTNKTTVLGLQLAAVNSNTADATVGGLQVALANLSDHTKIYGFQVGVYNSAYTVNGFQVGVINKTENLRGLQIGLLNFYKNGLFSVCPVLNFGF